jgi:Fe2+ transport system protein FeoA
MLFAISNSMMTLNDIQEEKTYIVEGFDEVSLASDEVTRLLQLGFVKGCEVQLKGRAPFFKDPLLVYLGETKYAISSQQAKLIHVSEKIS